MSKRRLCKRLSGSRFYKLWLPVLLILVSVNILISYLRTSCLRSPGSEKSSTLDTLPARFVLDLRATGVSNELGAKEKYSIYGEGVSLQEWKERKSTWKPAKWKVEKLCGYLNITVEDAPHYLPVTLDPDHPYLLQNPALCGDDVIDVLYILHIRPANFKRRTDFRKTVANQDYFRPFTVRRLFLLGTVADPNLQELLKQEHDEHGDLLQGRFIDDYHNLTHKGVMAFNWITHHCPHVRHVFKLDDDVFVDTFRLLYQFLPAFQDQHKFISCTLWLNNSMGVYRKGSAGKWQVDDRLFRGFRVYPYGYCSGGVVLISGDLIPDLYYAARFAPVFWVDDLYLYGILPYFAGSLTYFYRSPVRMNKDLPGCLKQKGHNCTILAHPAGNTEKLYALFNETYRLHRSHAPNMLTLHYAE